MPRRAKPIYNAKREVWFVNAGEPDRNGRRREVFMSRPITLDGRTVPPPPKDDTPKAYAAAWTWYDAYLDERAWSNVDPEADPTVLVLFERYLEFASQEVEADRLSLAHVRNRVLHLEHFARYEFQGRQLATLLASKLRIDHQLAFVDAFQKRGYSPDYVRNIICSVHTVLNWAARPVSGRQPERILDRNPLQGVKPPPIPRGHDRYVEPKKLFRGLRWAARRARDQVKPSDRKFDRIFLRMQLFMHATGCRTGEACVLRWEWIDRKAGVIIFPKHKTDRYGKERVVYLSPVAERILERVGTRGVSEWVFPHRRGVRAIKRGALNPAAGEPWPSSSAAGQKLRKWFHEALALELWEGDPPKRVTGYTGRYGYTVSALEQGESEAIVAQLLGNSERVISDEYKHITRRKLKETAAKLAKRMD